MGQMGRHLERKNSYPSTFIFYPLPVNFIANRSKRASYSCKAASARSRSALTCLTSSLLGSILP